jgi:hypothetical protein
MTSLKLGLLSLFLFWFTTASIAQYKRRGETLQTVGGSPNNSKKKADYTVAQFKGKWQEFARFDRNSNTAVPFTDTIQLIFSDSNKVRTKTSVVTSMTLDGEADIDNENNLTVAADVYTIKSFVNNEVVLDDNEKFIYHIKKVDTFWFETLGKGTVPQNNYSKAINIAVADILGNWSVYRRQAKPGATSEHEALISKLAILKKTGAAAATGLITFNQGQAIQQLPCTITVSETEIKVLASGIAWTLSVYQADTNNFVFGTPDLMYFSKK